MDALLAGLFVFAMHVTDMTLDTLRLLFTMRGRKLLRQAGIFGIKAGTNPFSWSITTLARQFRCMPRLAHPPTHQDESNPTNA